MDGNKKSNKTKQCPFCGDIIPYRRRCCSFCAEEFAAEHRRAIDNEARGYMAERVKCDNPRSAYGDY